MKQATKEIDKLNLALNEQIVENIKSFMKRENYTLSEFHRKLSEKHLCYTVQYLGSLLNHPNERRFPIGLLAIICEVFNVSFEELILGTLQSEGKIGDEKGRSSLNTNEIIREYQRKAGVNNIDKTDGMTALKFNFQNSSTIVTNPRNDAFSGYLQTFYCYYYPPYSMSVHSEKKKDPEKIIHGILELSDEGDFCKACLKIDTSGKKDGPHKYDKIYTGYAMISMTVHSMYCIMYSERMGEFCFIMFRHFCINRENQNCFCRIAEVLSSSSGTEERKPTVLRMFLSNQRIKEKELSLIATALKLNHSNIPVRVKDLEQVANINDSYREIIQSLKTKTAEEILFLNEKADVYPLAIQYLKEDRKAFEFIMKLREVSYSLKYNKVSPKADKIIIEVLQNAGYYKEIDGIQQD